MATFENPSPDEMKRFLQQLKIIAVIGLSSNPQRPSYEIGQYLIDHGYEIIPVNPTVSEVLGVAAVSTLQELPTTPDLALVFRLREVVPEIVEGFLQTDIPALWLQPGAGHDDAAAKAKSEGRFVVSDQCIRTAHTVLISP